MHVLLCFRELHSKQAVHHIVNSEAVKSVNDVKRVKVGC